MRKPTQRRRLLFLGTLIIALGNGMALNLVKLSLKDPYRLASLMSEKEPPFDENPRTIYSMGGPDLSYLREKTSHFTLWILPGQELRCSWKYNYFCKFFHAVRCHMLGGFAHVRIARNLNTLQQLLKAEDIVLLPYRSKTHEGPDLLKALNLWRLRTENTSVPEGIRIGIFHVSNEFNRQNWAWYPNADFVLRNYWLPEFPAHVQYIPLHHQMPSICQPESPLQLPGNRTCSCQGKFVPKSSARPFLYSFSGSIRNGRGGLLAKIRRSQVLKNQPGKILVSRHFGGDRVNGADPKTRHLASILDSMFVFAPCGNVMETHRIYEALALGAIPIIQNCEDSVTNAFFPYRQLLFENHKEMIAFLEKYVDKDTNSLDLEGIDAIQKNMLEWWNSYSRELAEDVLRVATTNVRDAS